MVERRGLSKDLKVLLLKQDSLPASIEVNKKNYTLETSVSAGFKGVVWKVRDEFGRPRALKLAAQDDYGNRSYLQELHWAGKLENFNEFARFVDAGPVKIDVGDLGEQNLVAFVEEWVNGKTLENYLSDPENRITSTFLLTYVRVLCNALSALRVNNLRHDDLHMGNVMIADSMPGDISENQVMTPVQKGKLTKNRFVDQNRLD